MTKKGNTFVAEDIEFEAAAGESMCYFNLTDKLGATWDELNASANVTEPPPREPRLAWAASPYQEIRPQRRRVGLQVLDHTRRQI